MPAITYPNPQVEFIIGPQVAANSEPIATWYDSTSATQGKYWANQFLQQLSLFTSSNHYDLPLCLYILYYRTNDPVYLDLARQVAKKWWESRYVNQGKWPVDENGLPDAGSNPGPLYMGTLGLTLYALDGHPEVFGFLDRITRGWMDIRLLGHLNDTRIYTDLRDEGYMQLSAVTLAKVLPDSFPQVVWDENTSVPVPTTITVTNGAERRAKYLADVENVAINYFGRLQQADGSWRWALWSSPGPDLQALLDKYGNSLEQPFMIGIYMESVTKLHALTQRADVKASLQTQLLKHCDHIKRDCYIVNITEGLTTLPRVMLYYFPKEYATYDPTASDRHLTTTVIHSFGYAYKITGNVAYKEFGDELWDSCFAVNPKDTNPITGDPLRSLMDQPYYQKLFTAEFRSSGHYLAWRGATEPPPPPPPPPVDPDPVPTPCTMTVNNPVLSAWGTGKLAVTLSGLKEPTIIRATATSGQVTVSPASISVTGTSAIVEFQLQAKKKSSSVVVSGPCGTQTVMVTVR